MLGPRFAQCTYHSWSHIEFTSESTSGSRLVASSSTRPLRNMHSTTVKLASLQRQKPPGDVNPVAMRHKERKALAQLNKPHVVLGHRPGDEAKWLNCDLAKILVTPEEIESMPPLQPSPPGSVDKVVLPKYMNFGLGDSDKEALFEVLPSLSLERTLSVRKPKFAKVGEQSAESTEAYKATMLARVVDLRNANARGIAFENRRRCIAAFSEPGKPNDSGRAEVQGALFVAFVFQRD